MLANHRSATISVRCVNWNSWNSCEFLLALSSQLWRHWSTSVNRDQWDHCESQHPPLCIYAAVKDTPHDDSEWDILHLTWLHFSSVAQKKEQTFTIFLHFLLLTYTCTSMMLISACVVPVSLIRLCFWQFTNWTVQILICCSICFLYRVYPHLFGISVFLLSTLRLGFFFAALPRFSSPPHCHCWGSLFYRSHLLKLRAEDAFSV